MHLSDGGHFENLGMYELIRRRCKKIVCVDGGADPEMSLDELALIVRLAREDFGVEIEIDTAPLRASPSKEYPQLALRGTVHYPNLGNGPETGDLLFFKLAALADAPADLSYYRAVNSRFPHESTADEVYSDAQWDAYRRLGELAVEKAFEHAKGSALAGPGVGFFRTRPPSAGWAPDL